MEGDADDETLQRYIEESDDKHGVVNGPQLLHPLALGNKSLAKKMSNGYQGKKASEVGLVEDREFKQDRVGPGKRQVMPEWWQSAGGDASSSERNELGSLV